MGSSNTGNALVGLGTIIILTPLFAFMLSFSFPGLYHYLDTICIFSWTLGFIFIMIGRSLVAAAKNESEYQVYQANPPLSPPPSSPPSPQKTGTPAPVVQKRNDRGLAEQSYNSAKAKLVELKKHGTSIEDLEPLLRGSKTSMERGEYKRAEELANKCRIQASQRLESYQSARDAMSAAATLVEELDEKGISDQDIIVLNIMAKERFKKGEYDQARMRAEECQAKAQKRIASIKRKMPAGPEMKSTPSEKPRTPPEPRETLARKIKCPRCSVEPSKTDVSPTGRVRCPNCGMVYFL
jgi:hypothetical protein